MTDFNTLDTRADACENQEDKLKIYLEIVKLAQTDKSFRQGINFEKYMKTSNELVPLLPKSLFSLGFYGYKTLSPWDPFSTEGAIPGSEESVCYSAFELASRGIRVTVYLNTPTESVWRSPLSNPRWLSEDDFSDPN